MQCSARSPALRYFSPAKGLGATHGEIPMGESRTLAGKARWKSRKAGGRALRYALPGCVLPGRETLGSREQGLLSTQHVGWRRARRNAAIYTMPAIYGRLVGLRSARRHPTVLR